MDDTLVQLLALTSRGSVLFDVLTLRLHLTAATLENKVSYAVVIQTWCLGTRLLLLIAAYCTYKLISTECLVQERRNHRHMMSWV